MANSVFLSNPLTMTSLTTSLIQSGSSSSDAQVSLVPISGAPTFFSNPATSGMVSLAGPVAGEFVGFHHFHNGASLTWRNSFFELEFWGYNGTSYQPVFTMISTATKNLTQVRKPDDSTSIELYYPSTGLPRIAPEQASGTNVAGVDLEVGGGAGTGTGTPGALSLMAPSTTGSGSSVQSLAEIIKVRGTDVIFNKPIRLADTGAAVAGAGAIRMQNAGQINARNAANSNNITLVDTTSDVVRLGGDGTAVTGIQLQPGTGDIRWGKALVALGGGSSATLGTIGGSGPSTATQNTWMRVTDSSGAAFWVPAWK